MDNAPVVIERQNPASMIEVALTQGADLEKLEKLLELQERWERNEARKAYTEAMAAFKANPPKIEKNKHVKFATQKGVTEYDHADLYNVSEKINSSLSAHGLHASWSTKQSDGAISVTCKITHLMGHFEETTLSSKPDESGGKNSIQAIGSAISYLQRYTLLALAGLATKDQDDDGTGTVECINDGQLSQILDYIDNYKVDEKKFTEYMGVDSLNSIKAKDFNKAINALKAKAKK